MPSRKKSGRLKRKTKKNKNKVIELDENSRKFAGSFSPTNVIEQKERFLKYGISPEFQFSKGRDSASVEKATQTARNAIHTEFFLQAKAILDRVRTQYKDGMDFIEAMYGQRISVQEATEYIEEYIKEHDLVGEIAIYWTPNLTGSAKMCWKGPSAKHNKPESRMFSLVVKSTDDNIYLREYGIKCLMNHEIGTHYFRAYNDGFQPWYSDRKKFGLHTYGSRNSVSSEEGLACINTTINGQTKYLWGSALSYYTSCKSLEMSFEELFEHLAIYVPNKDHRWKLCMRVKRALSNPDQGGGMGHDQVYFEGAANILSNLDSIDLAAMFSGRVCYDQTSRTKRLQRTDCLRLPNFLKDFDGYMYMLRYIAYINGLGDKPHVPIPNRISVFSDGKFDYDSYRQKRDGKSKMTNQLKDSPYMCFISRDSPVPRRPFTSQPGRQNRIDYSEFDVQCTRKDFIYPSSPVQSAHYVRLKDILYPGLNLDLDTSRSVTSLSNYPPNRNLEKQEITTLPQVFSVTDRTWKKR